MQKKVLTTVVIVVGISILTACKNSKPVGLTKIPTVTPVVRTVKVPGPAQPLGGGNPLPGGNPSGGGTGTTIVEIPQDPINQALGNNFSGNDIEDRAMFLAQTVHFDFDSTAVRPDDLQKVQIVAQHLIQNPKHSLMIEGHCDERGTEDYNISLGERRALAVADELSRLGISPDRLRTTSYGEKLPDADGSTEQSYAQNRRGEFVLLKPAN
jgi:peptidoglycan-associated lipoprotein